MPVGQLIGLIERAYEDRGGLKGQRPALKTKTALTIRQRLISDLVDGAIVPPVVIGVHCLHPPIFDKIDDAKTEQDLLQSLGELPTESISIIDGMQRTTAFLEAYLDNSEILESSQRVEFWISDNLGSLIYRMLVLNTGQVPWEISRQLETIYSQFIQSLRESMGQSVEIFLKDDERRRREAAQYQASTIVRLFLSFASRKMEFDLKDRVAEDFARIDTVEASSHREFFSLFVQTMRILVEFDTAFSRATNRADGHVRIPDGRSIFQSYPALAGFVVAMAVELFDEPGFPVNWEAAPQKFENLLRPLSELVAKLNAMNGDQVEHFLALDVLNERLAIRTGQVGRFERDVFYKAFRSMFRNADRLETLQPCWIA